MNIPAYLERIGCTCDPAPSREHLQRLLSCHLQRVPFENLDFYRDPRALSLDPGDLFDKVVTRRRGGVCFELNGLFLRLLQELGYDCYPVSVRVLIAPDAPAPISHQGNIAILEGRKYYCDVGFGGPGPKGLVELDTEEDQTIAGECFRVTRDGVHVTISRRHGDGLVPILSFVDVAVSTADFEILLYYFTANPDSYFVQHRVVNLSLENGSLALTDDQFTRRENGTVTTRTLDESEIDAVLKAEFGLSV